MNKKSGVLLSWRPLAGVTIKLALMGLKCDYPIFESWLIHIHHL
jgi:hypothetical protein